MNEDELYRLCEIVRSLRRDVQSAKAMLTLAEGNIAIVAGNLLAEIDCLEKESRRSSGEQERGSPKAQVEGSNPSAESILEET